MKIPDKYWETEIDELLEQLETSLSGLSETEAEKRISVFGHNIVLYSTCGGRQKDFL
jgi:hypothetical protein